MTELRFFMHEKNDVGGKRITMVNPVNLQYSTDSVNGQKNVEEMQQILASLVFPQQFKFLCHRI